MKFKNYGKGVAKGMGVTAKHLFRKPITTQYPEEKLDVSRRVRGNQLIWNKETCSACSACSRACPANALTILTSRDETTKKLKIDKIELDAGICISCGLCVEACPQKCLLMSTDYERGVYSRRRLVLGGGDLTPSEKQKPSGYYSPENEAKLPKQTLLIDRK